MSGQNQTFSEIECGADDWQDIFGLILRACTGHHGTPPTMKGPNNIPLFFGNYFGHDDAVAADEFVQDISTIFPAQNGRGAFPSPFELEERMQKASWLIAGLVVLCDWIGSNKAWFPFREKTTPLAEYWENYALPQAKRALREAGIGMSETPSSDMSFHGLFPSIVQPTPLQHHVEACSIADDPQLFILEDATGSGKTEAALLLAGRLMANNLGNGLFVALPTMATSPHDVRGDRCSPRVRG